MRLKILKIALILGVFIASASVALAQTELVDIGGLKAVAVPLHLVELALAVFISFMALKFFRITKPIHLFLLIYAAGGFFIISSLLYLMLYFTLGTNLHVSLVSVYIASRVALVGMLLSFVIFFYQWNNTMRKGK